MSAAPNEVPSSDETVNTPIALCIGCGYLLQGLKANGQCPECGASISESAALAGGRNQQIASALRAIATSYLLLLVLLPLGPLAAGIVRSRANLTLRVRSQLGRLPLTEHVLRWLAVVSALQTCVGVCVVWTAIGLFVSMSTRFLTFLSVATIAALLVETLYFLLIFRFAWILAGLLHHEGLRGSLRPLFFLNAAYWILMYATLILAWPLSSSAGICAFGGALLLVPLLCVTFIEIAKNVEREGDDLPTLASLAKN